MTSLMNLIDNSIPKIDKGNQKMKLRIRKRRKKILKTHSDKFLVSRGEVVLEGKRNFTMQRKTLLLDPEERYNLGEYVEENDKSVSILCYIHLIFIFL